MNKIYNILAVIILVAMSSCSDGFLNQPPRGSLTAGAFPINASDAELATNASYNSLRDWQLATGGFPILDIMSDQATKGSAPGDGIAIGVYDQFAHTALEGSLERYYKTLYESIRRANLVITRIPEIDMDAARKDQLLAEARFLRAYYYGLGIRSFGALPLVIEVDPPLNLSRTAPEIIMDDIIIPDLEFAISILPEKSEQALEDRTRATKGSARGLLARLYLYQNNTVEAERYLLDLVESQEYELVDQYSAIFPAENEHNTESVFEISALPFNTGLGGNQYANTQAVRGSPNLGWGFCRPAYSWISTMQDSNDPRLEPSVIFLGELIGGSLINGDSSTPDTIYNGSQIEEIECYNQKVWHSGSDPEAAFGHNRRIIRYADVLLMTAEVLTRNNKPAMALDYLNSVRRRAAGSTPEVLPDITTTDQAELLQIIMDERNRELALEGQRFWDLVRTDRAEELLGPLGFIKGKNEFLPIPQSEIDISEGRIIQNSGY